MIGPGEQQHRYSPSGNSPICFLKRFDDSYLDFRFLEVVRLLLVSSSKTGALGMRELPSASSHPNRTLLEVDPKIHTALRFIL